MFKSVVLCFTGLVAASASAIVVQDYSAAEAAPAGLNWSYVYNYNGSSAVAVGGGWLLTAAHVADDGPQPPDPYSLSIGGTVYNQQEIVYHSDGADRADLALVRFDRDFPGYYPLYTEPNPNSLVGLGVLMVGFGTTGTVYADYFTASGAGRNTRRWGSQVIDRARPFNYPAGGMVGYTKNLGFWMDFDLGHTTHEAGTGLGDSGGGTFYNDGGVWKLVGIMTSRQEGEIAGQYTGTYAVSMPAYAGWIATAIPEPGAIRLIGLSTFGLFLARARQRRKPAAGGSLLPVRQAYLCDAFISMEEREAKCGASERTDTVWVGLRQAVMAWLLPARSKANIWCKGLGKVFWNHMVVVRERRLARKNAFRSALKKKALDGLDAFLAVIMK